jgi:hypothetical protein
LTTIRKILDVNSAFEVAKAASLQSVLAAGNQLPRPLIRGDQVLLRWRIFKGANDSTPVDLSEVDGFEFVATKIDVFGARTSGDVLLYSADTQFRPGDWTGWSLANGRISCRVNTNTTNLLAAIGTEDTLVIRGGLFATHKLAPAPADNSSSSSEREESSSSRTSESLSSSSSSSSGIFGPGYLTCLWLGTILVQNDVWRIGQGDLVEIILDPPAMNSSSSSSSSTEAQTTSSSDSSSSDSSDSSASSSSSSGGSLLPPAYPLMLSMIYSDVFPESASMKTLKSGTGTLNLYKRDLFNGR